MLYMKKKLKSLESLGEAPTEASQNLRASETAPSDQRIIYAQYEAYKIYINIVIGSVFICELNKECLFKHKTIKLYNNENSQTYN